MKPAVSRFMQEKTRNKKKIAETDQKIGPKPQFCLHVYLTFRKKITIPLRNIHV